MQKIKKEGSGFRRKLYRKVLPVLLVLAMAATAVPVLPVSAASTRKCYTISSGNTTVYSNTGLTRRYGLIYGTDEITVLDVQSSYCKVRYPVSRGTKTGYIPTSAILTATSGSSCAAGAQITTYRRPGGASYGYIAKNDKVTVLGTYGSYTQIRYPVSWGYKYAFVTTDNANIYLSGNGGGGGNSASMSEGTYVFRSALDNSRVMDASGDRAVTNGTNIQLYTYNGGDNQKFTLKSAGSGWYRIICNWGNKAVDVWGGVKGNEVNVALYDQHGGSNQQWRFIPAGNGYYYIQNGLGYYLDVWNNRTANGTNIQTYEFNGGNNQKWKLESVSGVTAVAGSQADALVNMAKSQLGVREKTAGSDDITYNEWYHGKSVNNNSGFYPWCAVFVSWCAYYSGIPSSVIPKTDNTTSMKNGLVSRGGTAHLKGSGYQPVHGDIIFFGSNAGQHVGIVDYTSGNTVYYIDGNNTSMTPHGVHYSSCSLNRYDLWGFVTPGYTN